LAKAEGKEQRPEEKFQGRVELVLNAEGRGGNLARKLIGVDARSAQKKGTNTSRPGLVLGKMAAGKAARNGCDRVEELQ